MIRITEITNNLHSPAEDLDEYKKEDEGRNGTNNHQNYQYYAVTLLKKIFHFTSYN